MDVLVVGGPPGSKPGAVVRETVCVQVEKSLAAEAGVESSGPAAGALDWWLVGPELSSVPAFSGWLNAADESGAVPPVGIGVAESSLPRFGEAGSVEAGIAEFSEVGETLEAGSGGREAATEVCGVML